MAHQLFRFGVFRSAQQLRLEAIQHIHTWRDHYEGFVGEPLDTYVEKMKSSWEYGDHLTLIAVAREYNVQFLIISSAGLDHAVIVSNDNQIKPNRQTLTLGHFPENHYVSVEIAKETLNKVIEEIGVDENVDNVVEEEFPDDDDDDDDDESKMEGERREEDGVTSDEVEDEVTCDEVKSHLGNEERRTEGGRQEEDGATSDEVEDGVTSDEMENHLENERGFARRWSYGW